MTTPWTSSRPKYVLLHEEELYWQSRGEWAIRVEMERRIEIWLKRKQRRAEYPRTKTKKNGAGGLATPS